MAVEAAARPRTPGIVYTALAVVLIVVVGVLALTSRQAPPPTIAEFAPQAQQQIRDAPAEQSSRFGSGAGGEGVAGEAGAPTPAPSTKPGRPNVGDVARVRRCIGDPPRQTEDPQSPPCIAYWQGDNHGASWKGVSSDAIDICIPTSESQQNTTYKDLESYFNLRYEFYGRRLVFHYVRNDLGVSNPTQQIADADTCVETYNVFASSFYRSVNGFYFQQELGKKHVTSANSYVPWPSSYLAQYRPYMWQYLMSSDEEFRNIGEWVCKRLVGANAAHAGDPTLQGRTRVFGVILQSYYDADPTSETPLLDEMKSTCGVVPAVTLHNPVREDAGGDATQALAVDPATSQNAMVQMQDKNVTSVICLCQLFTTGALMKAATNQRYFPEWLLSTYGPNDINASLDLGSDPIEQFRNAFGTTFQPRQIAIEDEPFYQAIKEVDPAATFAGDSGTVGNRSEIYRPLLLLASGIQMAGPVLTPETFADGLHRTVFPNPDTPTFAGHVGFRPGSSTMTLDGAEWWFKAAGASPYTGGDQGAFCYVDHGKRWTKGNWPRGGDPFFAADCDSGAH